jgi:DNA-binding transcriptional ArsR family regulator
MLGAMTEAAFQALADPRRRAILRLVRDRPRSVNEIAGQFDITQQAVSQHLKVLKDAGLVAVRPQGQRRLYVVRPEGLEGLRDFLAEFWPASLQRLKEAVEAGEPEASEPVESVESVEPVEPVEPVESVETLESGDGG